MVYRSLSMLSFLFCAVGVMVLLNSTGRADEDDPPFQCPASCTKCEKPSTSTVYCKEGTRCEAVSSETECYKYSWEAEFLQEEGLFSGAYGQVAIADIDGGQKPNGCDAVSLAVKCVDQNFECWKLTYCRVNQNKKCETDPNTQGPAQQSSRRTEGICPQGPGGGD